MLQSDTLPEKRRMRSCVLRGLLRGMLRGMLRWLRGLRGLRGMLRGMLRVLPKPTISARWW
jgi:hypothetical protein